MTEVETQGQWRRVLEQALDLRLVFDMGLGVGVEGSAEPVPVGGLAQAQRGLHELRPRGRIELSG